MSPFWVIVTGVLVFCAGQFVLKFIIELAQEQAKAISEACFRLIYYAPWYANPGIHLRRDTWVSVMYAEGLNSAKSSVILQSTDRHGILGEKSADFQVPL
jgi:hypothetical protein